MPGASGGPASSIAGRAGPQPSSSGGSYANVGPGAGTMDTWLGSLCSGCLCPPAGTWQVWESVSTVQQNTFHNFWSWQAGELSRTVLAR